MKEEKKIRWLHIYFYKVTKGSSHERKEKGKE
jgi:hypothetical protein